MLGLRVALLPMVWWCSLGEKWSGLGQFRGGCLYFVFASVYLLASRDVRGKDVRFGDLRPPPFRKDLQSARENSLVMALFRFGVQNVLGLFLFSVNIEIRSLCGECRFTQKGKRKAPTVYLTIDV